MRIQNMLKRNVAGFIGAFLLSFTCLAEETQLADNHPNTYLVQKGDTLWDISSKFLQKPWLWPKIWHANPEIANPNLIYPGDTLNLVYVDGKPQIVVNRGDAGKTVKLSPDGDSKLEPRVRVEALEEAIPAIPLDVIDPFLSGSRIVSAGQLDKAPYVLQGSQKHVVSGAGDTLYARGQFEEKVSVYGVFRKGKTYTDDKTGEVLGLQAIDIGTAKILSAEKDIGRFSIARSTMEILANDKLLPNEERRIESIFYPGSPESNIEGDIIDVEGGVSQIGQMSVVLIDQGERDGLEVGNVLAIYQKGDVVRDPMTNEWVKLSNERAGLLMVFNVFEKISYALVLVADRPLAVGDVVRNP